MERLGCGDEAAYSAIEAAIHLNRYLLAKPYCAGKRVLDVACGEGYGGYMLAERWGAEHVVAVDVSAEALATARDKFASPRITYQVGDAQALMETFEADSFDLVVSFETIEHVPDPRALLQGIQHVLRPGGVVLISCPNDWWYYPTEDQGNPYHQRKYTFDEFRELAEAVLGPPGAYLLGTPAQGFVNLPLNSNLIRQRGLPADALVQARAATETLVPLTPAPISSQSCSFFVGLWGATPSADDVSLSVYPTDMSASWFGEEHNAWLLKQAVGHLLDSQPVRAIERPRDEALTYLIDQLTAFQQEHLERADKTRHAELRAAALQAEVDYLRERIDELLPDRQGVLDLKEEAVALRQTIADQARLVDERDTYIKKLENLINGVDTEGGVSMRSTIENQGRLIEERDAYIRTLEQRQSELDTRLVQLEQLARWSFLRPFSRLRRGKAAGEQPAGQ